MKTIQNQIPLTNTIDRLITDFFYNNVEKEKTRSSYGYAPMNIQETENDYLVDVIAPGYEKKNFSVVIEHEMLIIEAKVPNEGLNKSLKTIRSDYNVTNFKKMVHIDRKLVGDPQDASYENGILSIVLPKLKKEMVQRTQVHIK
jgi:HSP20 family protein